MVLALASVAVLVGGRLSEHTRRVGLLKAVGATPATVAAVLLAEHLAVTILAAAAGILIGWALAPLLTGPGAGLLGTAGSPPLTISTVAIVVAAALAVAILATLVPAVQAAHTSTIAALADAARPPRRHRLLIAASSRIPVPLLLGVRVAARRPRRAALGTLSVAVSVAGIVAVLIERSRLGGTSGLANPQHQRITQVLWVITVMLIVIAAINAILITWATVIDGRHASALARALGATPQQVSEALTASQFLSVLPGSLSFPRHRPGPNRRQIKRRLQTRIHPHGDPRHRRNLADHERAHRHPRQNRHPPLHSPDPASRKQLTGSRRHARQHALTADRRASDRHHPERRQHQEGPKNAPKRSVNTPPNPAVSVSPHAG